MPVGAVAELRAAGFEMGSKTLFDLLMSTFRFQDARMFPSLEKFGLIEVPAIDNLQGDAIAESLVHRAKACRQSTLDGCHQPDPRAAPQILIALERIVQCAFRRRMHRKDKRGKSGVEDLLHLLHGYFRIGHLALIDRVRDSGQMTNSEDQGGFTGTGDAGCYQDERARFLLRLRQNAAQLFGREDGG